MILCDIPNTAIMAAFICDLTRESEVTLHCFLSISRAIQRRSFEARVNVQRSVRSRYCFTMYSSTSCGSFNSSDWGMVWVVWDEMRNRETGKRECLENTMHDTKSISTVCRCSKFSSRAKNSSHWAPKPLKTVSAFTQPLQALLSHYDRFRKQETTHIWRILTVSALAFQSWATMGHSKQKHQRSRQSRKEECSRGAG